MRTTSEVTAASPGRSSIASSGEVRVLRTLRTLFDALHGAGVHYCHWKSNWKLVEALRGERDLDLLVHRGDARIPRDRAAEAEELRWLRQGVDDPDLRRVLEECLPSVDFALFRRLEDAIESGRSGVGRFRLGRALASQLRHHRRFVRPGAT